MGLVKAGVLYFTLVFLTGWVLGPIRRGSVAPGSLALGLFRRSRLGLGRDRAPAVPRLRRHAHDHRVALRVWRAIISSSSVGMTHAVARLSGALIQGPPRWLALSSI
jgi:hypothetical protein